MSDAPASTDRGIQVLGLCRFSVPSRGAFQVSHPDIEARRAMLYDPARLEERFAWFEQVLLPGIAAQTDPAFRLVLLLGEDFPEPWRTRMLVHVADIPQLVAEFAPPLHHREICAAAMGLHTDPEAQLVAEFRLDDDDAVAVDYVERLRRDADAARGLLGPEGTLGLDCSKGIVLWAREGRVEPLPRYALYWTPALAVLKPVADDRHILDFEHHKLWQKMPTLTRADEVMFVRGAHGTNDSPIAQKGPGFWMEPKKARQLLRDRFRIDLDALTETLARARG
jgi:hypothetical protein